MEKWGAQPGEVTCVDVYLTSGELAAKQHTEMDLEAILGRIEASLAEMRAVHFDAGDRPGDESCFPQVEQSSRGVQDLQLPGALRPLGLTCGDPNRVSGHQQARLRVHRGCSRSSPGGYLKLLCIRGRWSGGPSPQSSPP